MEKLIKKLRKLKKYNVVGIKQSLEDEGATFEDLIIMRKVTKKTKIKLNVKIGGCEAKMIFSQKDFNGQYCSTYDRE